MRALTRRTIPCADAARVIASSPAGRGSPAPFARLLFPADESAPFRHDKVKVSRKPALSLLRKSGLKGK
jgi:hypothetical protein